MEISFRHAGLGDVGVLGAMNKLLIEDERHRNPMGVPELVERMRGWLEGEYRAAVGIVGGEVVAYALWRKDPEWMYLRQLFVTRGHRREGIGRAFVEWLKKEVWAGCERIRVEALTANPEGLAFWRAVGFEDYCITLEMTPGDEEAG
jgi:GNAT superfamily N-acetyltransferase